MRLTHTHTGQLKVNQIKDFMLWPGTVIKLLTMTLCNDIDTTKVTSVEGGGGGSWGGVELTVDACMYTATLALYLCSTDNG